MLHLILPPKSLEILIPFARALSVPTENATTQALTAH
jgi:hypothetical protein